MQLRSAQLARAALRADLRGPRIQMVAWAELRVVSSPTLRTVERVSGRDMAAVGAITHGGFLLQSRRSIHRGKQQNAQNERDDHVGQKPAGVVQQLTAIEIKPADDQNQDDKDRTDAEQHDAAVTLSLGVAGT